MERPPGDTGLPGSPNRSWGITHHRGKGCEESDLPLDMQTLRQCPGPCLGPGAWVLGPGGLSPGHLPWRQCRGWHQTQEGIPQEDTVCSQEQGSEPQKCRFKSMPSLCDLEQVI